MNLTRLLPAALTLAAGLASAGPVHYTFEGRVTQSSHDGFQVGDALQWVFLADTELDGFVIKDGTFLPYPDQSHPGKLYHIDYFHAELVSGNVIPTDAVIAGPSLEYRLGYQYSYPGAYTDTYLIGSNTDPSGADFVRMNIINAPMATWSVGMGGFTGQNSNSGAEVFGTFTLTAISGARSPESVPEPATMALLGLGLAALGAYARRRRRKN